MIKPPIKYFGLVLIPFVTFLLGWNVAANQFSQTQSSKVTEQSVSQTAQQDDKNPLRLSLFWETLDVLKNKYVDESAFNEEELMYGSIAGMVSALGDPYTVFMDPDQNKNFKESLIGQLEGIGAELTIKDGLITVVSPIKNSPAKQAGLQPEDIILAIDDEETTDFTLEEAVIKIRGPRGSKVKLTVMHKGAEQSEDIHITRDVINIESVSGEMKDDQIAYISINQFGDSTVSEFQKTVSDLLLKQPHGLILDLRFNSGGYLDSSVHIISEFIEENKTAVTIKKRTDDDQDTYKTFSGGRFLKIPMVVLINKGSASASEIVAGALQDYERAWIIGEQSFGKGTVQEVVPLTDGSSVRVTIAKWYTPNDHSISEKGVTPDQEVTMTIEDYREKRDPQMDAALEYLKKKL